MAQSSLKRFFIATLSSEAQPNKRLLSSAAAVAAQASQSHAAEDSLSGHSPQVMSAATSAEIIEMKRIAALERKAAAELTDFADLDVALPSTWGLHLRSVIEKPSWSQLKKSLHIEQSSGKIIFPPPSKVFAALHLTPLPDVRAVIVGQDP